MHYMGNLWGGGGNSLSLIKDINKMREAQIFSFEERCIGTWVDGKPLYRKMIDFGNLPDNSTKIIPVAIENILHLHINIGESIWIPSGQSFSSTKSVYTLVHPNIITANTDAQGNISIRTNATLSVYKALVCTEYTKITD